ncbi:TonB-dependent siderophore receptor [Caulobacter sp. UNC358MFTsu5.1]|uniref:TonB-dependent receptor plug domain-containing protein n=1 Tax=Caulobacter sp. UNC358MFTsu5.1 TaxID=1449049 RepID=UPI0004A6C374|nr:TonB-dependent receptor [Caulobacter sp. UNC358MFTsu5.1]
MKKLSQTAGLLAGGSLLALAGAAFAQEAAPDAAATVEEIVVTGSRVIKNGDASPSPVTVVQSADALRVQPGTLADALQILPVFAGSRGSGVNPTSTGSVGAGNASANQLNLRNIGPNRTLVLLDGQRVPPTLLNGVVDVDVIPQMLVQRVDTVTGGVSAVYGSDAMSGVVNYVIDKKFEGLRALAQTGVSSEGDGKKVDVGFAAGTKFAEGRGHFEGSYEYRDEKGIPYRSDRDWMNLWGVAGAGTTANPYTLYSNVHQSGYTFGGLIGSGPLAGQTFATNGVLRPFVHGTATGSSALEIGGEGAYYDSSLLASLKGQQVFGRVDYDLSDSVHAYVQVGGNKKTNSNFSDYLTLNKVTMNSQNAFLAPAYRTAMAGVTTFTLSELVADAGRLEADSKSDQWIYTAGLDGGIGDYKWGLDFTHGKTELKTTLQNNVNNQRLAAALDAVTDGSGNIVCNASLTNSAYANCKPLNVFGPTAANADAIAYVMQPTHYTADTTMDAVSGQIAGSPVKTWAGDVNIALSAEMRKLSFESKSDALPSDTVNCTGLRYNCTVGGALWTQTYASSPKVSQTVKEAALEVDVPLLKDASWAQALNINGAARYTDYDTSGNYWTWKVGFDWRVNDALRFRGTKSRDIRAPTLYELFAPVNSVPVNPVDLLTGLSPRVPSTDLSNPDLTAEIGKTTTAGLVWNPAPGLSVALDGYHITVTDAIAQIAGSTAAYQQACYASGGSSPFCALQTRPNGYTDTSASNAVTRWYTKYYNIAEIETWGADLEVNYAATLFDRPANLRFLGAWQPHVYYRQPGVTTTDQGGVAFGPLGMAAGPSLRITALARFQPAPNVTLDLMERWRDSMKLGGDPTQVWADNHIGAFATTSVTLTYEVETKIGKTDLFLNVQNLFDADPPGGAYSGNGTRAGMRDGYAIGDDVLGRYFTVGARLKL